MHAILRRLTGRLARQQEVKTLKRSSPDARSARRVRRVETPPYSTNDALKRFDQRRDAFSTTPGDLVSHLCTNAHGCATEEYVAQTEEQNRIEQSVCGAARHVYACLGEGFFGTAGERTTGEARHVERNDPAANAALVKQTARRFGADLIGICRLNPKWLYACDHAGNEVTVPDGCAWAVVMAVAMDAGRVRLSPRMAASAASGLGYMQMAVCASGLALFIRALGYTAIAAGNGTALSIPLAADAGPELSFETVCESNNPGVLRWPVNAHKCYAFWQQNGTSCSTCIAACPYMPA